MATPLTNTFQDIKFVVVKELRVILLFCLPATETPFRAPHAKLSVLYHKPIYSFIIMTAQTPQSFLLPQVKLSKVNKDQLRNFRSCPL